MSDARLLDDLTTRLGALIATSPVKDLEKNLRALVSSSLARFDLVTRDEFELERLALARARETIGVLEARIAALEARNGAPTSR